MARMYPSQIFSGTNSPGEVEIFTKLRDDPFTKDWIVLHSLDIAEHKKQLAGEIDFVVIVPYKGILCLEVKACRSLRREKGLWYYGTNPKPDRRGPFKQASSAMHSVRERLAKQAPQLSNIMFWSAVIFPYIEFSAQSGEWHSWQALDARDYVSHSIGQLVLSVLNRARTHLASQPCTQWFDPISKSPSLAQCRKIRDVLRPEFEFYESPQSRTQRREEELRRYTEEQFDALDAMETNPQVVFSGPAGTGKTLLALENARRSQAIGRRVLFVCFNRLLGHWLKEQAASLQPDVIAQTV